MIRVWTADRFELFLICYDYIGFDLPSLLFVFVVKCSVTYSSAKVFVILPNIHAALISFHTHAHTQLDDNAFDPDDVLFSWQGYGGYAAFVLFVFITSTHAFITQSGRRGGCGGRKVRRACSSRPQPNFVFTELPCSIAYTIAAFISRCDFHVS